ncbi:restriction modification system DNA specificity domain protein [Arcticibacter svalbardensis MN12-7]|uniref:Restriction modification system DNA specificity domain protein n=2 Tax=Arcticibacter TaxID=1288026 RepID=R9GPH1_9SPHI|nr:restriction modification system DNA specificity domain protein [Arcticibacter svalbardensis MN12-7]
MITNEHFQSVKRSECKTNDIIISKIGANFGMSGILPELNKPSLVSGNTLKLTVDTSKYCLELIHFQLLNLKQLGEIDLLVKGSAQPALSMGEMSKLQFPLSLDITEQQEIVVYIKDQIERINSLVIKNKQEIEFLGEYKTALISEVVTGKVDVRDEIIGKFYTPLILENTI